MDGDTGEFESRFVINPISIKTNNISSLSKITLTLDSDIAEKLFDILVEDLDEKLYLSKIKKL